MKLSEVTTQTEIPHPLAKLSFWDGPKTRTVAEAFAALKKERIADLYSGTRQEVDEKATEAAYRGLDRAVCGESLTIGQVIGLWYVARCNEINAEYMADIDMTTQKYASRLAGARRQITSKY